MSSSDGSSLSADEGRGDAADAWPGCASARAAVLREGYLVIISSATQSWQSQYFKLYEDKLIYYKNSSARTVRGFLTFDSFTTVNPFDRASAKLVIVLANRTSAMYLCATDRELSDAWLFSLKEAVTRRASRAPRGANLASELRGAHKTFRKPISADVFRTVVAHIVRDDAAADADAAARRRASAAFDAHSRASCCEAEAVCDSGRREAECAEEASCGWPSLFGKPRTARTVHFTYEYVRLRSRVNLADFLDATALPGQTSRA
ncbi:hypothetical protein M885DRAFT_509025 [Pelagophyceae sp. CCMP2097]|nr:hypothetical protein M885DRAFT_509025 [Pelagophyceae sp. CCMP2097]|mmetsp:Transcript_23412/g.79946  ORF Transcript_23412/g.79946 Transcript_23412/m.79946 type:complete len:263 (+) Transcript_23412:69-857(+)